MSMFKHFYTIRGKTALNRFVRACIRQDIKYFTCHTYGMWYGATNQELSLRNFKNISVKNII